MSRIYNAMAQNICFEPKHDQTFKMSLNFNKEYFKYC